jgi:hypothetical protein
MMIKSNRDLKKGKEILNGGRGASLNNKSYG